ncbi:hypothetical protein ONA00_01595 [Mycoplasmopsis cynos]|uniref:16S rRNA uridine-516 pseudouridylate synthase and related pseudouridylate synthase n=1 Tax=Mycoplasmopsis cynos (strain C142) TaxID=1246955 RepID=L0RV31_MYCC1|nr:16S rRNA uridine-516 pseudouridylate synthase and related pseudouridylate synthase [Mycoplasmopsis cynos]WAM11174.1 hypothetical protein ONA00_01595 [Mycoplasmopsis cynos]CCP24523.1 16S rRNA uridine-516 pseudouridylate synthase and related pseudouridylate synthase [Mycoplasmopsis cynos C142]
MNSIKRNKKHSNQDINKDEIFAFCPNISSCFKFHQIKRMFQAFNYKVIELKRIKFNNLKLPNSLKLGSYIVIKKEDLTK